MVHRPGKSNCVADAFSRRPYPESEVSNQTICQIENSSTPPSDPSPEHVSQVTSMVEEEKCPLFVYFGYSEDPKAINVLSNTEVGNTATQSVNLVDLPKLQQQCPDFQHIYAYLKDNVLPEDDKTRQVTVAEVRHFDLVDDILYHWYQRRVRKAVNDEVTHVRQIALPRVLREEALYAYHECSRRGSLRN